MPPSDERPNGNGSTGNGGPWGDLPMWARPWARALSIFGLPTILVGFFLARDAGLIPSPMQVTIMKIEAMARALLDHDSRTARALAIMESGLRIQRAICRNSAKSDIERLDCDR